MKLSTLLKLEYIQPEQDGLQQQETSNNQSFLTKDLSKSFKRKLSYVLFASLQEEKEIYYQFKPRKPRKFLKRETSREKSDESIEMMIVGQSPNSSVTAMQNNFGSAQTLFKMQSEQTIQFVNQILKYQQSKREKAEKQGKQEKKNFNDQQSDLLQVSGQRSQLNQFTDLISSFRSRLERLKHIEQERKKFKKYTNTNNLNDSESETNQMSTSRNDPFLNEYSIGASNTHRLSLRLSPDKLKQKESLTSRDNSPSKRRIVDLKKLIETQIMHKEPEEEQKSKWTAIKASLLKKMNPSNQQQKDEENEKLEKLASLGSKFTQRLSKIDDESLNKVKKLFLKNESLLKLQEQSREMDTIYEKRSKTDRENKDNKDTDLGASPKKEDLKSKMTMKRLMREQKLKELIESKKNQKEEKFPEKNQPEQPTAPLVPKRRILTKEQIKELLRPSKSALLLKLGFDLGNSSEKKSQVEKAKKKIDRRQTKFQPQIDERQLPSLNDSNEVEQPQKPKIEINQKELKQLASEINRPLHEIKIQNQLLIQALSEQPMAIIDEKSKKQIKKYKEQIEQIEKQQKNQAQLKIQTTNADIYNDQAKELFRSKLKMYDFEQRGLKFMDNVGFKTVQKQHESKHHEDIPLYNAIFQTEYETDFRKSIFKQQWKNLQNLRNPEGLKQCSLEEAYRNTLDEQFYIKQELSSKAYSPNHRKKNSEEKKVNELEQIYFCLAQKLRPRRKITKIEKARFQVNQMSYMQKRQLRDQMMQIKKKTQESETNQIFQNFSLRFLKDK